MEKKKDNTFVQEERIALPGFERLGCGYDIFGDYASPISMQHQVFYLDSFLEDSITVNFNGKSYKFPSIQSGYFSHSNKVDDNFLFASGTSIHSFRESISNSLNIEGVLGAFTGSLSVASDSEVFKKSYYAYSLVYHLINNYQLEVFFDGNTAALEPYLIGLFKSKADSIQSIQDALDLMERFGTHVVAKLNMGKRAIQFASTKKETYESTSNFKLAAEGSFAEFLDAKFDYGNTQEIKDFKSNSRLFRDSHGTDLQNTIVEFPSKDALIPIWKVYKDNNGAIAEAFQRLTKTYQFITTLFGKKEQFVTGIDFNYYPSELEKKGYEVIKKDGSPNDMRENLGGEYIYMGIKKSSLLEVLQGAQPVTNLLRTRSDDSKPKKIEGYTAIDCDFFKSEHYKYEYVYYQQVDWTMPTELTDLLAIGNSLDYDKIKEQAYIYAGDDSKFQAILDGLQTLETLKEKEKEVYGDLLFSSLDSYASPGQTIGNSFNPNPVEYYEDKGYKIISENLVKEGVYGDYLYILGKPVAS